MTVHESGPIATHAPQMSRMSPAAARLNLPRPTSEELATMANPMKMPIAPGTKASSEWLRLQNHEPVPLAA